MAEKIQDGSMGKTGFIQEHDLYTSDQKSKAQELIALIDQRQLKTIRIAWPDQHGILRGKHISSKDFSSVLRNGIDFQTATLFMDTSNALIAPIFEAKAGLNFTELAGGPDSVLVPDPLTFKILPWADSTGWCLSEMYLSDGKPCPFDSRLILRNSLKELNALGFDYLSGLEVEFYITKLEDAKLRPEEAGYPPDPPEVSVIAHGFQYLTDDRQDEITHLLDPLRDQLELLGLPLRTMEDEWGPGQCEFTFDPRRGIGSADDMVLFRSAAKQICRRRGYHATFMTRPALPNFFSSGWHLHQSLVDLQDGKNLFASTDGQTVTDLCRHFVGGLLKHAAAGSIFATPTINGYKRFRPNSFAPDRITWAVENRGAMLRIVGGGDDPATHIENRAGEPCANPYLYMASQIVAGLDGIASSIDPGEPDLAPYESQNQLLPRSLMEARDALSSDVFFRNKFGERFIDYMLALKRSEIDRFLSHVTDWEQREYFEVY